MNNVTEQQIETQRNSATVRGLDPDLAERNLHSAKIGDKVRIIKGHLYASGTGTLVQAESDFGAKDGNAFDADGDFAVWASDGLNAEAGVTAVILAGDFEVIE